MKGLKNKLVICKYNLWWFLKKPLQEIVLESMKVRKKSVWLIGKIKESKFQKYYFNCLFCWWGLEVSKGVKFCQGWKSGEWVTKYLISKICDWQLNEKIFTGMS